MNIVPLLGCSLKSDEIMEFLELWDADVVYDFDRLHENVPDEYHAAVKRAGVQMVFDETQALTTVFLHVNARDDFTEFDLLQSDIQPFDTIENAKDFAAKRGISATQGNAVLFGIGRDWIKFEFGTHSVHYEFIAGALDMVTVTRQR